MDRLLADFDQPTLRLGILPRTAQMPTLPFNAFNLHDNTVVHVELVSFGLDITSPTEVALHHTAFDLLNDAAVHGDAARALIEQARTHWRRVTTVRTTQEPGTDDHQDENTEDVMEDPFARVENRPEQPWPAVREDPPSALASAAAGAGAPRPDCPLPV